MLSLLIRVVAWQQTGQLPWEKGTKTSIFLNCPFHPERAQGRNLLGWNRTWGLLSENSAQGTPQCSDKEEERQF
jgi:hypothetical protein